MFTSAAMAQDAMTAAAPSMFDSLIMFLPIILIFWFLILRPQNKRMKQHREMIAAVSRGDSVVTGGGLIGKVHKVTDDEVTIDLAEGIRVRAVKSTLQNVMPKNQVKAEK